MNKQLAQLTQAVLVGLLVFSVTSVAARELPLEALGGHALEQQTTAERVQTAGWDPSDEEFEKALEKWVDEYVRYIITDEEKTIYKALPTDEQRVAFIDRFWEVRDPTPGTPSNEYRREHLERFAIATQRFSAGKPGWATDRGRMFIILGAPNQLNRNPTGRGGMERASEVWTYSFVGNPLLPPTLDLSFVDFHGTGEFELVSDLDAAAPISDPQFGYTNSSIDVYALRRHASSIYDERVLARRYTDPTRVAVDFLDFQQQMREIAEVPTIYLDRLRDVRLRADTEVRFDTFTVPNSVDYYEAIGNNTAVQVTVALSQSVLRPNFIGDRLYYSADLYVALDREGDTVVDTEKTISFTLSQEQAQQIGTSQILQPLQLLAPAGSYDLIVLARDNVAELIGRTVNRVEVPDLSDDGLRLSSLTFASRVERVPVRADEPVHDFQHGDLRVVPNVGSVFFPDQPLMLYLQVYGLQLDPQGSNNVTLRGQILRDGNRFLTIPGQHPHPAPMQRQAFSLALPLRGYPPGRYEARLEIVDEVAGTSAVVSGQFVVLSNDAVTNGGD